MLNKRRFETYIHRNPLKFKNTQSRQERPSCLLCVHKIIQFVAKWLTDISKKHIIKIVTITI